MRAEWTGRNREAVDYHIDELAAIGIAPPSQVPLYYRVSNALLTQENMVEVLGDETSGEVEPLLLQKDGEVWIGLASDHTDRELWKYDEVKDDLDKLVLRCSIKEGGEWAIYQQGPLSNIRPLAELMQESGFGDNSAMLCGTLSAIGGVRPATEYRMELEDPIRNRRINMNYSVRKLPVVA